MSDQERDQQAVARMRELNEELWESIDDESKRHLAALAANVIAPGIQQTVTHYEAMLAADAIGTKLSASQATVAAWWAVEHAALLAAAACSHGRGETVAEFLTAGRESFMGLTGKAPSEDVAEVVTTIPIVVSDAVAAGTVLLLSGDDATAVVNIGEKRKLGETCH